jgi:arginyl-tRNA synthetase
VIKKRIEQLVKEIVKKEVKLEHPARPEFGDYSTNVALENKINPAKIIESLKAHPLFDKVEKAGPGFINFFLSPKTLQEELSEIIKEGDDYGKLDIGQNKRIQVEFISANPTGPLTVGNARGGPFGDVLANILNKAGFKTEKAYYVNDAGQQILELGKGKYQSDYVDKARKEIKEQDAYRAGQILAKHIVKDLIQKTTDKLGIKYDEWIFESDLHKSGKTDKILNLLQEKHLIYEQDGAQWFKSKRFGDERDRVMIKQNGRKTYLAGDLALHQYKFDDKKFDKVINVWGADHHGDIPGLTAGLEALGYKDKLEIILLQFVTIIDKGKKQKMSKRAGAYVLMDELLDKVGVDAVRFFFLQKSADTHLNFDLDLAEEQSNKNPVFYVQYAHARICSILKRIKSGAASDLQGQSPISHSAELDLTRQLVKFPEIIEDTAQDYQIQRLSHYSLELANSFHKFYEQCQVLGNHSRINLVKATQIVLKNTLVLMGVSTPEKM